MGCQEGIDVQDIKCYIVNRCCACFKFVPLKEENRTKILVEVAVEFVCGLVLLGVGLIGANARSTMTIVAGVACIALAIVMALVHSKIERMRRV